MMIIVFQICGTKQHDVGTEKWLAASQHSAIASPSVVVRARKGTKQNNNHWFHTIPGHCDLKVSFVNKKLGKLSPFKTQLIHKRGEGKGKQRLQFTLGKRRGRFCILHFVFIWSGKLYFYQENSGKSCELIFLATNDNDVVFRNKHMLRLFLANYMVFTCRDFTKSAFRIIFTLKLVLDFLWRSQWVVNLQQLRRT